MKCDCNSCEILRELRSKGVSDKVINYFIELEMEQDRYSSIFEGKWPSGKERLIEALGKYGSDNL